MEIDTPALPVTLRTPEKPLQGMLQTRLTDYQTPKTSQKMNQTGSIPTMDTSVSLMNRINPPKPNSDSIQISNELAPI